MVNDEIDAIGEPALMIAFRQNRTFGQALQEALSAQADVGLTAVLADHVRRGALAHAYS